MNRYLTLSSVLLVFSITPSVAQQLQYLDYEPTEIVSMQAVEISRYNAVEAIQGVAVDTEYVYPIVNYAIGKYDKTSGGFVDRWAGNRDGLIRHLNSCFVETGKLYCANSNYPETPMANSIEVFDTSSMQHIQSYSLGAMEEGTFNWFNRLGEGWLAGFAHYDGRGGVQYKDHSFASLVRYDSNWRRVGGWMLPEGILQRMEPMAASGGAIGPDGLLYITGHDRPEMYVLAAPKMGPKLIHIATVIIDTEGQAFSWDNTGSDRVIYTISRPAREVRGFQIPEVDLPDEVYRLTDPAVLDLPF